MSSQCQWLSKRSYWSSPTTTRPDLGSLQYKECCPLWCRRLLIHGLCVTLSEVALCKNSESSSHVKTLEATCTQQHSSYFYGEIPKVAKNMQPQLFRRRLLCMLELLVQFTFIHVWCGLYTSMTIMGPIWPLLNKTKATSTSVNVVVRVAYKGQISRLNKYNCYRIDLLLFFINLNHLLYYHMSIIILTLYAIIILMVYQIPDAIVTKELLSWLRQCIFVLWMIHYC